MWKANVYGVAIDLMASVNFAASYDASAYFI
jgi:hypothetical protein